MSWITANKSSPSIKGWFLVVSQGDVAMEFRAGNKIENLLLEIEAVELQKIDDFFVMKGHGSVALGSVIPRIWDSHIPSNQDGASIEGELHGPVISLDILRLRQECFSAAATLANNIAKD